MYMVGFFGVGMDDVGVGRLISAEPGWRGKLVFVLGCVYRVGGGICWWGGKVGMNSWLCATLWGGVLILWEDRSLSRFNA